MAPAPKPIPVYTIAAAANGHVIRRNGTPVKTPAGADLVLPTSSLAEVIAEELRALTLPAARGPSLSRTAGEGAGARATAGEGLPLMQLAATAIDIAGKDRTKITAQLAAYTGSELLCHRAEQPTELVQQQERIWNPLLDWCSRRFGATLQTGTGIMPIAQSPEASQALRNMIEGYDDFRLAGLRQAVDVSGSLVLGLALAEDHLDAEEVFHAAELDATFQIEAWGEEPATTKRRADVQHDLVLCEKWFGLLKR